MIIPKDIDSSKFCFNFYGGCLKCRQYWDCSDALKSKAEKAEIILRKYPKDVIKKS